MNYDEDALLRYLESHPPREFKPGAFYNEGGDQLEVYWDNEACYYSELQGHSGFSTMAVGESQEKNIPCAVTVYSIQHLLADAGFKLVPLTENEIIDIFLKKHSEIKKVEWKDGELIAWYLDGPFKAEDFKDDPPTKELLEKLTLKLMMVKDRYDRQQNKSKRISEKAE